MICPWNFDVLRNVNSEQYELLRAFEVSRNDPNMEDICIMQNSIKYIKKGHKQNKHKLYTYRKSHQLLLSLQLEMRQFIITYSNMLDYQLSDAQSLSSSSQNQLAVIDQSSAEDYTGSATPKSYDQLKSARRNNNSGDKEWVRNISQYQIEQKENTNPNILICSHAKTVQKFATQQKSYEARLQIFNQMKVFKIFQAWKLQSLSLNFNLQIEKEKENLKQNLRIKFAYFKEWKTLTIKQKRAKQYYRKRIYRVFFMTCSQQLQLRLRSLYVQEVLKLSFFPTFLARLRSHHDQLRIKGEKIVKKMNLKGFLMRMKEYRMQKNILKLGILQHELQLKKKSWLVLQSGSLH